MKNKGISLIAIVIIVTVLIIITAIGTMLIIIKDKNNNESEKVNLRENISTKTNEYENSLEDTEKEIKVNREAGQIAKYDELELGEFVRYIPDKVEEAYPNLRYVAGDGKQENLKWRILRVYENGDVDLLGDISSYEISLQGADGYNNGVYYLNDYCKTLYSKKNQNIYARSINLEDLEYYFSESEKNKKNGVQKIQTVGKQNSNYPDLYAYEVYSGVNSDKIKESGIQRSDDGSEVVELPILNGMSFAENGLTVKDTNCGYKLTDDTIGEAMKALTPNKRFEYDDVSYLNAYFLATRCVYTIDRKTINGVLYESWAKFGIYEVRGSTVGSADIFWSDRIYQGWECDSHIRPVVRIPSNVKFITNENGEYDLLYADGTTTANQEYNKQEKSTDKFWEKYEISNDNGMKFASDQLDISFNDSLSAEKCEIILKEMNVKNYYNYSKGILNTYIVQLNKKYDKIKDIEDYANRLKEKYEEIESATPNYLMNISIDT